jgi:hypothetical protein
MFVVRYGADDHKNHLKTLPRLPCRAKLAPLWFLDGIRMIRGNIGSYSRSVQPPLSGFPTLRKRCGVSEDLRQLNL